MLNNGVTIAPPPTQIRGFNIRRTLACIILKAVLLVLMLGVAAITEAQSGVQITGPVPWIDVMAYGAKGDGVTDDHGSINTAISKCPNTTATGCTVFFPLGTYNITGSIVVGTANPGVALVGQCMVVGVGTSCSKIESNIASIVMLQVGDTGLANTYQGLRISNLQFTDTSGAGNVKAAVQINLAQHFLLDSVFCNNLKGTSASTGVCLNLVGGTGGASTQYGVVFNLATTNTRFPVQTVGKTSSVNLFGGDIECNLATAGTGSVGMDIGLNHGNGIADHNGGEWGVFGTHILNCDTAIGLVDSNAFQDYAILEQTGSYLNSGTGVSISTVFSPTHTVGTVVAGNMISFSTGVSIGSGVDPITISTTFANFLGGTKISGSSSNSVVVSPTVASNLPMGLSLGIPGPTAGTTGTLIFANSTTANTIKLTPAAPTASRTYTVPDGGGSSSIGLTTGTLTNGDYASWDANGNAKDSGTSAGPYSIPWITASNNATTVTFSTTANTEKLWGAVLTFPLTNDPGDL